MNSGDDVEAGATRFFTFFSRGRVKGHVFLHGSDRRRLRKSQSEALVAAGVTDGRLMVELVRARPRCTDATEHRKTRFDSYRG